MHDLQHWNGTFSADITSLQQHTNKLNKTERDRARKPMVAGFLLKHNYSFSKFSIIKIHRKTSRANKKSFHKRLDNKRDSGHKISLSTYEWCALMQTKCTHVDATVRKKLDPPTNFDSKFRSTLHHKLYSKCAQLVSGKILTVLTYSAHLAHELKHNSYWFWSKVIRSWTFYKYLSLYRNQSMQKFELHKRLCWLLQTETKDKVFRWQ